MIKMIPKNSLIDALYCDSILLRIDLEIKSFIHKVN
jgi:hypothetical protein